jgi:hypothetical protein
VGSLAADQLLAFRSEGPDAAGTADTLCNRTYSLTEVVIPPRSGFVGQLVFPGLVTPSGDLVILAVQRRGGDQGPQETTLTAKPVSAVIPLMSGNLPEA